MKSLLLLLAIPLIAFSGEYLGQGREVAVTDRDSGFSQGVDSGGRAGIVQHAHPDTSTIVFSIALSASEKFNLIDLSDITNWKHTKTDGWAHIENVNVEIDASGSADYVLDFGFLDNVDATNGDFYGLFRVSGNKKIGASKQVNFDYYPNGPRGNLNRVLTNIQSLNDVSYQTDVNMKSTFSSASAITPTGNGDIILNTIISAGSISLTITISYHSDAITGE